VLQDHDGNGVDFANYRDVLKDVSSKDRARLLHTLLAPIEPHQFPVDLTALIDFRRF